MMVALGLPLLIGATGFAVDTAQWYMWKRELQHSVDQAALAGAWALAHDPDTDTYTLRAQQEYGANLNQVADYASDPTVNLANFQGGTDNSVVVTAQVSHKLPFTDLITGSTTIINVSAQAAFETGTIHRACLMTLQKDGTSFIIGNGATVQANCGIMALSCDPDKPSITVGENASIDVNQITVCREADLPSDFTGELVTDPSIGKYDFELPAPEPADNEPTRSYVCGTVKGVKKATPLPGLYPAGITIACNTTFAPGVYFVRETLDLTHNAIVSGYGVMFVLLDGAQLKMGGSGANGTGGENIKSSLNLTPPQASELEALGYDSEFANMYESVLVVAAPTESEVEHTINGNVNAHIQGKLHLPTGNVKVNGTAEAADGVCFQISANTINVLGGAYLKSLCDEEATNSISVASGVRLIA
ncbi:MAG: pilus assembly protein TadG-related protein [Croceibacterium sp.]